MRRLNPNLYERPNLLEDIPVLPLLLTRCSIAVCSCTATPILQFSDIYKRGTHRSDTVDGRFGGGAPVMSSRLTDSRGRSTLNADLSMVNDSVSVRNAGRKNVTRLIDHVSPRLEVQLN